MSRIETYYPGLSVGEIADRPFGLVFLDFILGAIDSGDPDDKSHERDILDSLDSRSNELEQQRRQLPIIQDEVDPKAVGLPLWIWHMSNMK